MAVYRIRKETNYVVMCKTSLQDERLSWKAKGLHAYMLSMPDDWKFYDEELKNHAKDGIDALKTALKELKDLGYMKRVRSQDRKGKFNWETLVFEKPYTENPLMDNPSVEEPLTDNPSVENPQLLNNKGLSNKELSIKITNSSSSRVTVEEVMSFWDNNGFGFNNIMAKQQLLAYLDEGFTEELLHKSLEIACDQNIRTSAYVKGILNKWEQEGVKTLEDVEGLRAAHEAKGQRKGGTSEKAKRAQQLAEEYDFPY